MMRTMANSPAVLEGYLNPAVRFRAGRFLLRFASRLLSP
jgi:hypothetical protein